MTNIRKEEIDKEINGDAQESWEKVMKVLSNYSNGVAMVVATNLFRKSFHESGTNSVDIVMGDEYFHAHLKPNCSEQSDVEDTFGSSQTKH